MINYKIVTISFGILLCSSAAAFADVIVSTGDPTDFLAALSRPGTGGQLETETADDFILNSTATINSATFYGLIPTSASLSNISNVVIEIYRVFPHDSDTTRTPSVTTRTNSPSDVAFDTRDGAGGDLTFSAQVLAPSFTTQNSVINGINKFPNQHTGGDGPQTGEEVQIDATFSTPFVLPADHYFFVPQVQLSDGTFLWLTGTRPIVAPGTPFLPDLQAWIRNENLTPDWSRIGSDIVGGDPAPTFNMAFQLNGTTVPEPSAIPMLVLGSFAIGAWKRRSR